MRKNLDQYFTPEKFVHPLIDATRMTGRVLECCSGDGAISDVLKRCNLLVSTNDIDENLPADIHQDATKPMLWKAFEEQWNLNWVVSNPPFNQAFEILQRAFETEANIAFLLRLSFLEPTFQRQEFLAKHPPTKLIVLPRFSFTADGKTDSVTCAWMIWERNKPATSITIVTKEVRT